MNLTTNQQQVFDLVEGTLDNILVLGEPGVGKSVLINWLREHGNKSYTIAAPTGLAALNVGGKTLHSLFRLPVSQGVIFPDFNVFPEDDKLIANLRYNVKHLIIDEISMVRADAFDYIDRLLRHVRNSDKPFGGVQIIAVGDFFQLPPVVVGAENKQLKEAGYSSPFIFSAACFKGFKVVQLNEVLRQVGDPGFIDLLAAARVGQLLPTQAKKLNSRAVVEEGIRISLTGTNKEALWTNMRRLAELNVETKTFTASIYGTWPAYPAEPELELAVGAQVMVKKNRADCPQGSVKKESNIVNGTLGVVEAIYPDKVEIKTEDGVTVPIYIQAWEQKVKVKEADGWVEKIVATYEQMPLALAWAISIHKSQGQSFDKVHIDASRIFAPGQAYVALSRARSLAGITLERPVTASKFFANRDVIRFYNTLTD